MANKFKRTFGLCEFTITEQWVRLAGCASRGSTKMVIQNRIQRTIEEC